MKSLPTQMQRTYSSKSMNCWSVITSMPLSSYAWSSSRMSLTRLTCFQPPPSAGFRIAGKPTYRAMASQSSGYSRLRRLRWRSIAGMYAFEGSSTVRGTVTPMRAARE